MKKVLQLIIGVLLVLQLPAQNFTGQWKGQFTDNSTSFVGWGGERCDYVLEIECKGKVVTGYSYTYFNDGGKRYYTICKLAGKLNKAEKYIEVTEVERTKTNVPRNIRNCFQVHRLTYSQDGQDQNLEGTWIPAPNQEGDCGYGTTSLMRRVLQKNATIFNNPTLKTNKPALKTPPVVTKNAIKIKPVSPTVKTPPVTSNNNIKSKTVTPPLSNNIPRNILPPPAVNNVTVIEENTNKDVPVFKNSAPEQLNTNIGFEKRNSNLIKTIEIDNESFRVDLYDNGAIDGDSISLFFNGKLLLSHKRLSDKAITLTLQVDNKKPTNELVMYAENLGEIPPNTALMVVTDGDNRYEVRISSDLEQSGVIRFIHKARKGQ